MCILMVEDEAVITEIMIEALEEAGYEVLTAQTGPEAVSLIETRHQHFSALFSDYHLPGGLTGLEVATIMRLWRPGLPVLLATGRPDLVLERMHPDSGFVLLSKPYRPSELLRILRTMVTPPGARTT